MEDSFTRIERLMAELESRSDPDPDEDDGGDSLVPALLKPKPSGRSGAVALPEPDPPEEQFYSPHSFGSRA
jgi:hypothetical protein